MHSTILQRKKRTNDLSPNYKSFFCKDIVEWCVDYVLEQQAQQYTAECTTKVLSTWYCHFYIPISKGWPKYFAYSVHCVCTLYIVQVLLFRCGRVKICKKPFFHYDDIMCVVYHFITYSVYLYTSSYSHMLLCTFSMLYIKYYTQS